MRQARARIAARIERLRLTGHFGDMKTVGEGVSEMRIDYGPGYRIYLTRKGVEVVILLCGGDKSSQARDIRAALRMAEMKTTPFDVQDYLKTPEERVAYLEAILEDGDADLIASGLGEIARAMGASELARQAGVSREAIYKGLVPGGNPTLDTLARITKALGLRLTVAPIKEA